MVGNDNTMPNATHIALIIMPRTPMASIVSLKLCRYIPNNIKHIPIVIEVLSKKINVLLVTIFT